MLRRTVSTLRRLAWLDFALASLLLALVLGAARGATHSPAARRQLPPSRETRALTPLGAVMPAPPDAQTMPALAGSPVTIQNFSFGPGTLTVSAGSTVTWTNSDSITHTVTAADGSFNSGNLTPGAQFSFTFSTPGTYSYHCSIHPFMTGQVVVQ